MLQRMCEDIEYIELLSVAAKVGAGPSPPASSAAAKLGADLTGVDMSVLEGLQGEEASLVRLMFVGAYAMSNYSSTVGRVQKPFNPMLGETYELVRQDKQFRYLSEQVCHHPPISACYCDSPDYVFWTEVNVKSKFWGKSLELHPLGTCHVRLPIPGGGGETEHYSWKKVTTAVNNLIVGKLWIDHYGDMVIRNWRTGEECVITFKPKNAGGGGWFGLGGGSGKKKEEDAGVDNGGGEIAGVVKDRNGVTKWELRGRWDDCVTAYPVPSASSQSLKSIVLWRRHPMPPTAAQNFNLTDFAVSLNQVDDNLRKYLPPTDSRLRPDQAAMERGDWDAANQGKERLELLQRERRKRIVAEYERSRVPSGPPPHYGEEGSGELEIGEKWWKPRWFVREVEADTGEEHWRFVGKYWDLREMAGKEGKWPEWVVDVFGE
ncbi:hypothetical protein HK104_006821 [Borealophlyctis nickersoniae]|nr:hypothetical protein HK104_006821 [Borealophlyctis nickersoniae]